MNKIFIFYPKVFKVESKFIRKLAKILMNVEECKVVFIDDYNGYIESFFISSGKKFSLEKITGFVGAEITHAIIFDDGEEFLSDYYKLLDSVGVVTRFVKIKITRVVNIDVDIEFRKIKKSDNYEYIGRGSYWGNPYSMYDFDVSDEGENSREEVIRKFKYDFDFNKFARKEKKEVYKLAGKRLGCFCKPHACHGDVLADFLNSWDDGE